MADELCYFRDDLGRILARQKGVATLDTEEDCLSIGVTIDAAAAARSAATWSRVGFARSTFEDISTDEASLRNVTRPARGAGARVPGEGQRPASRCGRPARTSSSGRSSTTPLSASMAPITSTSESKVAIRRGGKLTTPITSRPSSSSRG